MDLNEKLDRAFGLKTVFEAIDDSTLFDRDVWMTADPDVVSDLAYTNSAATFWKRLRDLAIEINDQDMVNATSTLLSNDPKRAQQKQQIAQQMQDVQKQARKEARRYADERRAGSPKWAKLRNKQGGADTLGMSPEQVAAKKQATSSARASQPRRAYPEDNLFGIYDAAGTRIRGGYRSEEEATSDIQGDPVKFPDPNAVHIRPYENTRSSTALLSTRAPLQNGWTEDEIVAAMQPFIRSVSRKYAKNYQDIEDLMQQGVLGVYDALKHDKGEAPFVTWAMRPVNAQIRRYAMRGTMGGTDAVAGASGKGAKGANLGYEVAYQAKTPGAQPEKKFFATDPSAFKDYYSETGRPPPRSMDPAWKAAKQFEQEMKAQGFVTAFADKRGSMASSDVPAGGAGGEGAATLGDTLKGTKVKTPYQIAMNRDQIKNLMDRAGLSDQQKKVIQMSFGLDQPEGSEGGAQWGSPEGRVANKYGPTETGEEGRKPGEQAGSTPMSQGFDPAKAKQEPALELGSGEGGKKLPGEKPKSISLVRGPVEVARALGISTQRVQQHRAMALAKLHKAAADAAGDEKLTHAVMDKQKAANEPRAPRMHTPATTAGNDEPGAVFPQKSKTEPGMEEGPLSDLEKSTKAERWPTPKTPQDAQAQLESLHSCMRLFARMLTEMFVTGQMNGVILG